MWLAVAAVLVATGGVWWVLDPRTAPEAVATGMPVERNPAPIEGDNRPGVAPGASRDASPPPGNDPNDLAAHFRPGDPEPTGAEVIEALQHAGVRTGLGAFNPPGTSPPLEGLAVPDDFDLPQGYVRHHQVTDGGVPIEPILMFSPDFTLYDAQGRAIPLPANRVVPPELAPPGLQLRRVRVR
ncbi:hypothetical protein EER27_11125 [Lysobacter psychrotolerans]|uniref:Uncharacterized protein n=1 Tax=Montanilutibacter psychrotolerans TaxID=1327343 RepID=A0A3M8SUC0_9GAMM|nr:hypothetical protein EER27_11125 [Lysobacter psychrotolerans]